LFGLYEDFPDVHHGVAHFQCAAPTQDLQRMLLQFLRRLNEKRENPSLAEFTKHKVRVEFDVGVADGSSFDYLDKANLERCLSEVSKSALPVLDLFVVVRYYVPDGAKRKPLKFDYYLVRTLFREKEFEMLVHHEKGPRHLAVEELVELFFNRINRELKAQGFSALEKGLSRTV
jgi:hypothetical protein